MKDYMKDSVRFVMRTDIRIGMNVSENLPDQLTVDNCRRIGCVIDKSLYDCNEYVKRIVSLCENRMDNVVLWMNEMPEPTYDHLDEAKKVFEGHDLDCFVAIGGGSTIDLTKGLATLMTNAGKAIDFRGFDKAKRRPLPVLAVPSTAGSGSEVTPYAVFIDTVEKWKFGINSEQNYPKIAFLDPHLLDSCPASVFASSGMDAMTHTLESFVAKNASILSRTFSRKAFALLYPNLKKIAGGDRSLETKLNLLVGADCAGIALMNSGAGPAGALSYPLGVYFHVPHGLAGSVFLPGVIRYNVEKGYLDYALLYDLLDEDRNASDKKKSYVFADRIEELSRGLGIPTELKGFGVQVTEDADLIIRNSMQLKAAFEQNPLPFGSEEIEKIVRNLM